ncbi:BTAD domain-containing putative transcriptional regulator [Nocardia sp. CC227C]|uniref:BTAD domain-containing putative transcriptional regulator n=1 Tax=Nocardia sp. CC227C TaxID=3044562 RepID=UPI00278BC162|nr:BTAD domain-containing putative transcriptional regulator [Nocardia sp. CC227C]
MRFGMLGALTVWTTDGTPVPIPEQRVRTLLAALLVREGRPVPADTLIDEVWGERLPADPRRVLRAKLSLLRGVLERAEPDGRERLDHGPGGYRLRAADDDARRFRARATATRAVADPAARVAGFADALALWRGPALADFPDTPFARPFADRLDDERITTVEDWAEARLAAGDDDGLADELGGWAVEHPLRERLHAAYLRALYRFGRQAEALHHYEGLRHRLAEELGVDPGPELTTAHEEILRRELPVRATPAIAVRTADPDRRVRGNRIPAHTDALVGREHELDEIDELLTGAHRLVTLTGPGGVGKTRLAMEVARGMAAGDRFRDGVWLVELAAVAAPGGASVARTVARILDIRLDTPEFDTPENESADPPGARPDAAEPDRPPHPDIEALEADRLARALRDCRCLLVLDNCEHVRSSAAALVLRLLRTAPELQCLVTSRQPLDLPGERMVEVPPLGCPPPESMGPDRAGALPPEPGPLESFAAVRLFAARAAASAPRFVLDERTAPTVAAICRRLDGLPLALELAARRVRSLGVEQLSARLDDRFRVLGGAPRTGVPDRQQTLRATIDWSWDLLDHAERAVLRSLVVHVDGCTLDAAEAVAAELTGIAVDEVLDILARLVDRSLVDMVDGPGGPRYRLLESIGAYAAEQLDAAGERARAEAAHLRYYTALVAPVHDGVRSAGQRTWLRRLDAEHANLRTAFDTAVRHRDTAAALHLAVDLFWYRWIRGLHGEARRSLTAALALPSPPAGGLAASRARAGAFHTYLRLVAREVAEPVRAATDALAAFDNTGDADGRSFAQWLFGPALVETGDLAVAENMTGRALSAFRARGDRWGIAAALGNRIHLAYLRGGRPTFDTDGAQALRLFTELGDDWGRMEAMGLLWWHAENTGDAAAAERIAGEGLALAEELRMWEKVTFWHCCRGRNALVRGEPEAAVDHYTRAERLSAAHGEAYGVRLARRGLGMALRRLGRLAEARVRLGEWLGDDPGDQQSLDVLLVRSELGFLADQCGDTAESVRQHGQAVAAASALDDPGLLGAALTGLAGAYARCGREPAATVARLFGAAEILRGLADATVPPLYRPDVERTAAELREYLVARGVAGEMAAVSTPAEARELAAGFRNPAGAVPESGRRTLVTEHTDAEEDQWKPMHRPISSTRTDGTATCSTSTPICTGSDTPAP